MKSDQPEKPTEQAKPKKKSGIFRILAALFVGGAILIVGGILILTSSWFITGTVLPAAGSALNSSMEASRVAGLLSSSLEVEDFKLTPEDEDTLVSVEKLSVGYDLMKILGGQIVASDLTVEGVNLELVMKADGSLNIDPILEALSGPAPEESETPSVDLKRLKVADSQLRIRVEGQGGSNAVYEVSGLNVEVDQVANAASATLSVSGNVLLLITESGQESRLEAQLDEKTTVALNEALVPTSFETSLAFIVGTVTGAFSDFAENRLDLTGKLDGQRLDPLELSISKAGAGLGTIQVTGPLDLESGSAELEYRIDGINQNLLNQFKDLIGFSFGAPSVSAQGGITVASSGESLVFDLALDGKQIQLENESGKSPELSVALAVALAADMANSTFNLQSLNLSANQGGNPMITALTEGPLTLRLGGEKMGLSDAKLKVTVTDLNLADWQNLIGEGTIGKLNSQLSIQSQGNQGESVDLIGDVSLANLVASDPDDLMNGLGLDVSMKANIKELSNIDAPQIKFAVQSAKGALLNGDASLSLTKDGVVALKTQMIGKNPTATEKTELAFGSELSGKMSAAQTEIQSLKLTLPGTTKVNENVVAISGQLSPKAVEGLSGQVRVASKALDLTPIMDFVDSLPKAAADTTEVPETADPAPQTEPEPVALPVKQLNATLQFDQLFARDIAINNWVTEAVVHQSDISVEPISLTVNGADVKGHAKLDLSVPGYKYDVALGTSQLPAGPLISSLQPAMKGVYDGAIDFNFDVDGAGTTGTNLKKNLKGVASFDFKGANIELFDSWKKLFMTPIALVLRVPAMLESPIQGVSVNSNFADGNVDLAEFKVLSPHFQVLSKGTIPIADDIMASTLALPVDLTMKKDMATGANLVDDAAEAIDGFVSLPPFVKVEGSVGEPKVNIDKLAVGKLFIRNVAGLPESVVGQAGQALQGLGGLVGGDGDEKNAAGKLIEGVGGLIGGEKGSGIKEAGSALRGLFNRKPADPEKK